MYDGTQSEVDSRGGFRQNEDNSADSQMVGSLDDDVVMVHLDATSGSFQDCVDFEEDAQAEFDTNILEFTRCVRMSPSKGGKINERERCDVDHFCECRGSHVCCPSTMFTDIDAKSHSHESVWGCWESQWKPDIIFQFSIQFISP